MEGMELRSGVCLCQISISQVCNKNDEHMRH